MTSGPAELSESPWSTDKLRRFLVRVSNEGRGVTDEWESRSKLEDREDVRVVGRRTSAACAGVGAVAFLEVVCGSEEGNDGNTSSGGMFSPNCRDSFAIFCRRISGKAGARKRNDGVSGVGVDDIDSDFACLPHELLTLGSRLVFRGVSGENGERPEGRSCTGRR